MDRYCGVRRAVRPDRPALVSNHGVLRGAWAAWPLALRDGGLTRRLRHVRRVRAQKGSGPPGEGGRGAAAAGHPCPFRRAVAEKGAVPIHGGARSRARGSECAPRRRAARPARGAAAVATPEPVWRQLPCRPAARPRAGASGVLGAGVHGLPGGDR